MNKVITITRQFGSGGREIGKKLAEAYGIPFYDNEIISRLKEHQSSTPSKWREKTEWRMKNKLWLCYSQHIAMMMLDQMEKLNINKEQLSKLLDCTQEYVSKILKGQENLTLETMAKIEQCLKIQIFNINLD